MQRRKKLSAFAITLVTVILMLSLSAAYAFAASYDDTKQYGSVKVELNGTEILSGESLLINSVTYIPLRAFSETLGADSIVWDDSTKTAIVTKNNIEIYVRDGGYYVSALGRYFYSPEKILNINGRLYVPIRALAAPFCVSVDWDGLTRTVILNHTGKALKSADEFYNSGDLYWLSRIISAESAGESMEGQIAVGNVVLNRRAHKSYPNTVYGVIFDRVGGTQFSPVALGTIYKKPAESSVIAAKICLEGYSISKDILFFMNPRIATSNWISRNRPFAFTIGNHDFYN